MRSIALVTDSSAALSPELERQLLELGGFALVRLPVFWGEQQLDNLPAAEVDASLATAHVKGEQVTTSGLAPGQLVDVYEEFARQGFSAVLSVHLSGQLSGTCDSARVAASLVDIPVAVVDSLNLAMALGESVRRLHAFLALEDDLEQAIAVAEELCAAPELLFFIPTLDALKRGGRVNPALAVVGQMLQIRPVATVRDGKLHYVERPRTTPKALERLVALTEQACASREGELPLDISRDYGQLMPLLSRSGQVVAIHYSANLNQAEELRRDLGALASNAVITPLPPVLAAHAGLGALATVIF